MNTRTLGLAMVVASVAVGIPVSASPPDSNPPISFAKETQAVLGAESISIVLLNNTRDDVSVAITAELMPTAGGDPIDIGVENAESTIPGGGSLQFAIGPATGTPGSGFVTVVTGDWVIRREIAEEKAATAPAVTEWTGSNVRDLKGVRLDGTSCSVTSGEVVVVSGEKVADLSYSCSDDGETLIIDDSDVKETGKYTGTLKIGDDSVSLTYLETSPWRWPVLMILFGFLLATWQQAWTNNYRPLWRAERRLTRIGHGAVDAQRAFDHDARGMPHRHYTFVQGVYQRIAQLQLELTGLRPPLVRRYLLAWIPWAQDDHKAKYDDVLDNMADLDGLVISWRDLSKALTELSKTIDETRSSGFDHLAQAFVDAAERVVDSTGSTGLVNLSYGDAEKLVSGLSQYKTALELLPVVERLRLALPQLRPLPGASPQDQNVYAEARQLCNQIIAELEFATDIEDVEKAGIDKLTTDLRTLLLRLDEPSLPVVTQGLPTAAGPTALPAVTLFARLTQLGRRSRGGIRAIDGAWLVLALAVAVWTGLALLYFDKPWGGWRDAGAMFVWAFGTTAVLTPLFSRLENLASDQLHLEKSDDSDE